MKSAGSLFIAVTLLFSAGAWAQDAAAASDKPYASIVARNMFGLLPVPPPPTNDPAASADPPPKITPNGIMTIFGKLQALFKVAGKGQAGQPPKDESYVLSEGERQDDIEVVKINEADGIVTFDNHGAIQALPLVAASNSTAPGGGPGGPPPARGAGFPGQAPGKPPMSPAQRAALPGGPAGQNLNPGNGGNAGLPNLGGNNYQTGGQPANNNIEDQVMSAAKQMAQIEQERIATQQAVDQGLMPPMPPTPLTPSEVRDSLIIPPTEVPSTTTKK
jgi:hypothetical protein